MQKVCNRRLCLQIALSWQMNYRLKHVDTGHNDYYLILVSRMQQQQKNGLKETATH